MSRASIGFSDAVDSRFLPLGQVHVCVSCVREGRRVCVGEEGSLARCCKSVIDCGSGGGGGGAAAGRGGPCSSRQQEQHGVKREREAVQQGAGGAAAGSGRSR